MEDSVTSQGMTSVLPPASRMAVGGGVESGLGASAEDGGGAEVGEFECDGGADAAACSGDDCDLPG